MVWCPQTQPETLGSTLTLPQLPSKGHLQAIMCYYPNCQSSGPLKQLREEETITPTLQRQNRGLGRLIDAQSHRAIERPAGLKAPHQVFSGACPVPGVGHQ